MGTAKKHEKRQLYVTVSPEAGGVLLVDRRESKERVTENVRWRRQKDGRVERRDRGQRRERGG
jgi:hypothetical protein